MMSLTESFDAGSMVQGVGKRGGFYVEASRPPSGAYHFEKLSLCTDKQIIRILESAGFYLRDDPLQHQLAET
jgi:hypothetical protein